MTRPASRHPTELELEILKVLWRGGEMRVQQVRDALAPARESAYTSVMTIMNIMVDKGYLRRRREGMGYLYRPKVTEKATARRMLRDLVDRAFGGSPAAVMLNLLESGELDEAEIAELRNLLDRMSEEHQR